MLLCHHKHLRAGMLANPKGGINPRRTCIDDDKNSLKTASFEDPLLRSVHTAAQRSKPDPCSFAPNSEPAVARTSLLKLNEPARRLPPALPRSTRDDYSALA